MTNLHAKSSFLVARNITGIIGGKVGKVMACNVVWKGLGVVLFNIIILWNDSQDSWL